MSLSSEFSLYFIPFIVLIAFLLARFLYYKDSLSKEISVQLKWLLIILRTLGISFILFFLLGIVLQSNSLQTEKPFVLIAQDNSSSLVIGSDSAFIKNEYLNQLKSIEEKLGDKFEVAYFSFGEKVNKNKNFNFQEKESDISEVFKNFNNNYSNRNIGAVILATDGIYNRGSNPQYLNFDFIAPLYTIALGDSNQKKDNLISNVFSNKIAFLGNNFPVEVNIESYFCEACNLEVSIINNGNELVNEKFKSGNNSFYKSFNFLLKAEKPGLQKYTVNISRTDGEISYQNNSFEFYIDVIDGRQKVLILANSPHPDISALKNTIEKGENYEVKIALAKDFNEKLNPYSLVIFHQIPSLQNSYSSLIEQSFALQIPRLFIAGAQSNFQYLNALKDFPLKINQAANKFNDVTASVDKNFGQFTVSDKLKNSLNEWPPLLVPFGEYFSNGENFSLLKQKIGMVQTESPLISFSGNLSLKTGVILGEGIWKWKMRDYLINSNNEAFDELISKTIQYLAVKRKSSQFLVNNKNRFAENEEVVLEAEIYNDAFELVNEAEVKLSLFDSLNKEFKYVFSKMENNYRLNLGNLKSGDYKFSASFNNKGKETITNGFFSVSKLQIENLKTVANHGLLNSLALSKGGKMYFPNQLEQLINEIKSREDIVAINYELEELEELINIKWLFFIIILFFSAEWIIRKWSGAY